ncbi:MAG TPA: ABC transporter ATP-binding protein [Geminicoccaceae bacterium]|nr:ABC transporter ATP-binding protein [Geminicoccus sp.]HMU48527.1 ABC transporter ATP-binding protein [Geminicoccaceae bacterium]
MALALAQHDRMQQERAPAQALLRIEGLGIGFTSRDGTVRAVDGLSFELLRGEVLAIVGESGCGKSVTALSVLGLLPKPAARVEGRILLEGRDLLSLSQRELRKVRGNEISMIFQEPMSSLNPVLTVGRQLRETLMLHRGLSRAQAEAQAIELLRLVRIAEPERRVKDYPFRLSGGMRQRVMIAMALACGPKLLLADEPTTALDVTVQAQIMRLILDLQRRTGTAVVLITHDLGVVAESAQRVIVMYAGRKVEEAPVRALFRRPLHPYTQGLMRSIPRLATAAATALPRIAARPRLAEIPGVVPRLDRPMPGCAFAPRCPHATAQCETERPPLADRGHGHVAACWHADKLTGPFDARH